jgi:hypothetical protein
MANQRQQRPGQPNGGNQNGGERREAPGGQRSPEPEKTADEPVRRGQAGHEADPESELEEGDRTERELEDEGDVD